MKVKFINVLLVTILLASCTKQTNFLQPFSSSLEVQVEICNDIATKGIINNTLFPESSEIGVQLINSTDGSPYFPSGITNIKYVADNFGNFQAGGEYFLSSNKGKLYAYYPFINIGDNNELFTEIPIFIPSVATAFSDTDYMYATPHDQELTLVNNVNNNPQLVMNHATAQIAILVYKDNYSGPALLSCFSIEDNNLTNHILVNKAIDNDLKMSILDGSISGGERGVILRDLTEPLAIQNLSTSPQFPSTNLNDLKNQVDQYGVYMLVAPTSEISSGDIKFGFVIDEEQYYVQNNTSIVWEKGKQYIYKVKLAGSELTMSSVTITDWLPNIKDEMIIQ